MIRWATETSRHLTKNTTLYKNKKQIPKILVNYGKLWQTMSLCALFVSFFVVPVLSIDLLDGNPSLGCPTWCRRLASVPWPVVAVRSSSHQGSKGDLDHSWNHRVLMGLNGLQKKCGPLLLRKKHGKRNDQRDDGTWFSGQSGLLKLSL